MIVSRTPRASARPAARAARAASNSPLSISAYACFPLPAGAITVVVVDEVGFFTVLAVTDADCDRSVARTSAHSDDGDGLSGWPGAAWV
jgi:hypothetical protein